MTFEKEHLLRQYSWTDDIDRKVFTGTPTRRRFDRFNGYQVLFIINLCGSTLDSFSVKDGQSLENLLVNNLPLETTSEISVFNWLSNFQKKES